jgi:hypothetical protein
METFVWACMAVAVAATLYFLLREPEDGNPAPLAQRMAQARMLALGASALGGVPGLWQVVRQGGGEKLFGMAVLFNVILACYWILRLTLAP